MNSTDSAADREKRAVALSSVIAAVALTGTKIGVGVWTNSIGILSEAAHSGLDLVAAAVTLWAVSVAGKPADAEHAYGHGKIENLSALFETALLFFTCGWIIWESVSRLFFKETHVTVNFWSFAVVVFSIVVDYSRSRALMAAARKHQSQALEADAVHFSTDIWSSSVVLVGLLGVLASERLSLPWLARADAVAALGVAVIVLGVCWKLSRKAIDDLLDTSSGDLREKVAAASRVPGVVEVRQVRARKSGPAVFVDVAVAVARDAGLERGHEVSELVEASVRSAFPGADVVVHVEPCADKSDPLTLARVIAARHGLGAHSLRICDEKGGRTVELHLEVASDMSLTQAHDLASRFESELRADLPGVSSVVTHLEPCGICPCPVANDPASERRVLSALLEFQGVEKTDFNAHDLAVRTCNGQISLTLHCSLDADTDIGTAHDLTVRLEKHLRAAVPELGRVVIHAEPPGTAD